VSDVILGIANWDAGGTGTTTLDENRGGTISQQHVQQGRYNVALNGRVTTSNLGAGSPILYLFNFNQGFVLGRDSTVFFGVLEPQTAPPPYRNQSIVGIYQGGTIDPMASAVTDAVNYFQADGNGHMNGDQQSCNISGCNENPAWSAGFQIDPSGRAVVTGDLAGFLYLVSPKKVVLLPNGSAPVLNTFSTRVTQ
jgi:hypothetical protein